MAHVPFRQMRIGMAAALVVMGACGRNSDEPARGSVAPSTSSDEPNPFPQPKVLNTGATCHDPAGDLSKEARATGGNLSEPAGIDLVRAESRLTEATLRVSFTTVAPIGTAPEPELRMSQGVPGTEEAFELRAAPAAGGTGPWTLSVVTFARDNLGRISERPPVILPTPVQVDGTTVSFEVPQASIPRVATFVWLFGSTSGRDDVTLDACDNSEQVGGQGAGSTTTAAVTTSTAAPRGQLGDALTYRSGSVVTVFAPVEAPPASVVAGAAPPAAGAAFVVVDARVCAPDNRSVVARRAHFFVKDTDDRNYASRPDAARTPAFPETATLAPGECQRGYVTAEVPEAAPPQAIIYSPDADGAGALVWNVN